MLQAILYDTTCAECRAKRKARCTLFLFSRLCILAQILHRDGILQQVQLNTTFGCTTDLFCTNYESALCDDATGLKFTKRVVIAMSVGRILSWGVQACVASRLGEGESAGVAWVGASAGVA